MKLYSSRGSPFARKAVVVAREHEIALDIELINVFEATFLDELNPLRMIPTLVLDDGSVLYDSQVICLYLDDIAGKPTLYPDKDRWSWQTRASLAHGLTEASVALRLQQVLPEAERSKTQIDRFSARLDRAIDALEAAADRLAAGALRIDQIGAACALGHVDFRHTEAWRTRCPKLAAWYDAFRQRPSLAETVPVG
ncbi:MAG: glutathione S-transferase family protein [Alphaproteobacteria bacterium]